MKGRHSYDGPEEPSAEERGAPPSCCAACRATNTPRELQVVEGHYMALCVDVPVCRSRWDLGDPPVAVAA